ncbi:hypothetical protein HRbin11_02108 [bacterium HR11]|nr:hypothetical protein HRbin11_02108 [bacterium HR11]
MKGTELCRRALGRPGVFVLAVIVWMGAWVGALELMGAGAGPEGPRASPTCDPGFMERVVPSWKTGGALARDPTRVAPEWYRVTRGVVEVDVAFPVVSPAFRARVQGWVEEAVRELEESARLHEESLREQGESPRASLEVRYAVGYLDSKLVSVLLCVGGAVRGAAHPWSDAWVLNFLPDEDRPLETAEMFRPGWRPEAAWRRTCARQIARRMIREESFSSCGIDEDEEACVRREAGEWEGHLLHYEAWGRVWLTAEGLVFVFSNFPHAVGEVQGCRAPWKAARPALRPEVRRRLGRP